MGKDLTSTFIFLGFGCVFLFFFFYKMKRRQRLLKKGIAVDGEVIEFRRGEGKDSATVYPVISFSTKNNEHITLPCDTSYPGFIIKKGKQVKVFYNESKPSDFMLDVKADWWLMLGLLIFGLLFIFYTVLSLTSDFKQK